MLCEFEHLSCAQVNCPILINLSTDYFTHLLSSLTKSTVSRSPLVLHGGYTWRSQWIVKGIVPESSTRAPCHLHLGKSYAVILEISLKNSGITNSPSPAVRLNQTPWLVESSQAGPDNINKPLWTPCGAIQSTENCCTTSLDEFVIPEFVPVGDMSLKVFALLHWVLMCLSCVYEYNELVD